MHVSADGVTETRTSFGDERNKEDQKPADRGAAAMPPGFKLVKLPPLKSTALNNTTVVLKFGSEGADLSDLNSASRIDVNEATDDLGTDLRRKHAAGEREPKPQIQRLGDPAAVQLMVELVKSPRKATKIKTLRGKAVFLTPGETRTVTVDHPKSRLGKPLEDPVLKQAGIELTLQPASPSGKDGMLMVGIKGDPETARSVRVLNPDGTVVGKTGPMLRDFFPSDQFLIVTMDKPIDDAMRVEIDVLVGQQPLEVPFDLKDIPLP